MNAGEECRLIDFYCLMYLQKHPWWMPKSVYDWVLRKFVVLAKFRFPRTIGIDLGFEAGNLEGARKKPEFLN